MSNATRAAVEHGTANGYRYYGCRCDGCRAANTASNRDNRARARARAKLDPSKIPHGTTSGYDYHGCRCDQCREGQVVRDRIAKPIRKQKDPAEFRHGLSAYQRYDCRCEVCLEAAREYDKSPGRAEIGKRYRQRNQPAYAARLIAWRASHDELADQAINRGKQWTGTELEIASRDDLTIAQIAAMLRRSYSSVEHVRQRLKGPDPRKRMLRDGPTAT